VAEEEEEESYRILAALEPLATALALQRMTVRDLDEVRRLERDFDACAEDDPLVNERNREFHFRIYECARSPLLLTLMRLLWQSFGHQRRLRRPHADSVREHREIVAALETGDRERAMSLVSRHALGSIDWMGCAPDAGADGVPS
jgi:DNA-binding GntR family transcriptional regulator